MSAPSRPKGEHQDTGHEGTSVSIRHPLDLQRCDDCGAWWALRPYACAACGGTALRWHRAAGDGTVIARSEVHRAPDPQWRALAPYVLVLVQLRENVTLMGHAGPGIAIGQQVSGHAAELNGRVLLEFKACHPP